MKNIYLLKVYKDIVTCFSKICNRIYQYASQFRWCWGAKNLVASHPNFMSEASLEVIETFSTFSLKNRLLTGWYMLEIQIKLPIFRVSGHVRLVNGDQENDIQPLIFPLYSDRMCKRLIHLSAGGNFRFEVPLAKSDFEIQHFRLVRVSKKFARSRMMTKLQGLHPRYKANWPIHQHIKGFDLAKIADLSILWTDYCALFEDSAEIVPYSRWVSEFDTLTSEVRMAMSAEFERFERKPLVSVVMPVYNPNPLWLKAAIDSVRTQIYPNWELCIADDASTDPAIRPILERYTHEDSRIKLVCREQNGHISLASNSALTMAQGEWVALLDHDDMLAEHALFWVVHTINAHPDCRMIYSDEDKIDEQGVRSDPYFKCDWNTELFYSQNMFSHLGVYHADLMREVGGFRTGFEGSQDYDLALRCIERVETCQIQHIPRLLYHWRIHEHSTAKSTDSKPYAQVAGQNALNNHFQRQNIKAKAEYVGYGYRVRYELPNQLLLVSIIIPTKNKVELLKKCIYSILAKTEYSNYEIIVVDNGSDERKAVNFLNNLSKNSIIRIVKDSRPFNYSRLNNNAVKIANGNVIALLNNDVEVINGNWLSEMVSHALRPEVGVVGAKLYYADNTIQHAGVILGVYGVAGHAHRFLPKQNFGYCGRANLIQSLSAVTGACMVVRKSTYQQVGGMNELDLAIACNDIDFCLKVREAGYRNIWTPYAELFHHESASRGFDNTPEKRARSEKEVAYMQSRWGDLIKNDPAYNPNLTLDYEDFSLAWPPRTFKKY